MLSFRLRRVFSAQSRGRRERSPAFSRSLGFSLLPILLAGALSSPAFAQNTGRVDGSVHDQSGAVVPSAAVTLRNEASGTELRGKTDATGYYSIDLVPPATYTLTVQTAGFKTYVQSGLVVHPADRLNVPVSLMVGHKGPTITGSAKA